MKEMIIAMIAILTAMFLEITNPSINALLLQVMVIILALMWQVESYKNK